MVCLDVHTMRYHLPCAASCWRSFVVYKQRRQHRRSEYRACRSLIPSRNTCRIHCPCCRLLHPKPIGMVENSIFTAFQVIRCRAGDCNYFHPYSMRVSRLRAQSRLFADQHSFEESDRVHCSRISVSEISISGHYTAVSNNTLIVWSFLQHFV